ncbi:histo-blood group ABO system transferase 2-like [Acridotheres tristis]
MSVLRLLAAPQGSGDSTPTKGWERGHSWTDAEEQLEAGDGNIDPKNDENKQCVDTFNLFCEILKLCAVDPAEFIVHQGWFESPLALMSGFHSVFRALEPEIRSGTTTLSPPAETRNIQTRQEGTQDCVCSRIRGLRSQVLLAGMINSGVDICAEEACVCLNEFPGLSERFIPTPCRRQDVLVLTPWLAPIVWEGTFSRDILNAQYLQKNLVTGVVTFAVEKYVQFIEGFMTSANKYFLAGHQVNFYLFTDSPEKVSPVQMSPENSLFVIPVQSGSGWQDACRSRMHILSSYIQGRLRHEVDYLFSMDIDLQLLAHVGVEIIDALVATISSWQLSPQHDDRAHGTQPGPPAASPEGRGDFHYTASFYGGSVSEVYKLSTACFGGLMEDREIGIGARGHHESLLNKYLLQHKPTRLLSPEYYWDTELSSSLVHVKRMCPVHKDSSRH